MPPKPKPKNEPSKKTDQKKKEKIIEDKTFGLKNKKGGKQQKFIKMVTQQVKHGNQKATKMEEAQKAEREKKKDDKKKEQDELNQLFRPVTQVVSKGADPKSVLCAFYKQGQCSKGDKCKFSHDLNLSRKGEKRSMYQDTRQDDEDNMENWDEAKLEEVVNKKHGEAEKAKPKTAIICKYFLEAVENNKYGWFWECPNGQSKCIYRHALPPGFVLKKDQKKEEKKDEISIEELIEKERASLGYNTTKVTLESFLMWKERKKKEKLAVFSAEQEKKKADYKAGKVFGISGRQMFEFNPDLILQDDDEAQEGVLEREKEEDDYEGPVIDINLETISMQAQESDGTGTLKQVSNMSHPTSSSAEGMEAANGIEDDTNKLNEAAALPASNQDEQQIETDAAIAAAISATVNGELAGDMPIDEELFEGEDIDLIDEDLDTLELED